MSNIKKIFAREILDSRGNPTVEVEIELESGIKASAAVPSGASTGAYEALELRDKNPDRYRGQGVLKAVENVNEKISKEIIGMEAENQKEIDEKMLELDGTENKSNLGANAILGVSLAVCRASAIENGLPLYTYIAKTYNFPTKKYKIPMPMFNIINGGKHSDSGLSIQEYKLVPNGIKTFKEQLRAGSEIFHTLMEILRSKNYSVAVGDEGGFAPKLESNAQALELINEAIEKAGYKNGEEASIGLDTAANSFYDEKEDKYIFKPENSTLTREMLVNIYNEWIPKYNIISIEDGLNENDFSGWRAMNEKIGGNLSAGEAGVMLIGDDLLVTNVARLKKAIEEKSCNAVLIKVNQIGTLSETINCIKLAKKNKMKIVVSHRSGETTDDFISDLAVGAGAEYIKSGSLSRGERICKYNRLLRIEEEL
ncbi:MAG: phosphopyruvate hydratase [Candidatus Moranbacteria bacterium RIFOXYA12_FULL_35_19]|nr:MAG: Enolase [Candidatus Moranbacteria bacterium GW2011_GWF2_35_39]OGI32373.1 MAG: phosphopyruvate hydratase [Candidatus Moranbacteria bacterium RIFOXYC12_FULL_36_13]OGI33256.1 MAG: phosphopyruvate hydratase [Candidatus Moranbacteria bacterium RIFOXYB12_FULL_35_8]OGI35350.1 MAG: phosphopyruvate hydratase [Candidatus Moranbacteria bacterium RIFOXYA12_FULL_35_19]